MPIVTAPRIDFVAAPPSAEASVAPIAFRFREQRGWTQLQLATTVGATQSTISRIEAGKVQPEAFLYGKLASAFGITVQILDHHVKEAMDTAKRLAANAVSNGSKSWDDVIAGVGMLGLIGLIIFAVAALLDGLGVKIPKPKV